MSLFEQLKNIPKIDLHINLIGSIGTNLMVELMNNKKSIQEIENEMVLQSIKDYDTYTNLPIQVLNNIDNINKSVDDLIKRLKECNVIYGELFVNLKDYSNALYQEEILKCILNTINKNNFSLKVVLCISDIYDKQTNFETIYLYQKYHSQGVISICFEKDKKTNPEDFQYIFDKLMREGIPYILSLDSKITNQNKEIYYKALRIEYRINELLDAQALSIIKNNHIDLEFPITSLKENNVIDSISNYFLYDLLQNNYIISIVTKDMTILNTDIINEYCLLFNAFPITIHDLIKMIRSNINCLNIDEKSKLELMKQFNEKCNEIL